MPEKMQNSKRCGLHKILAASGLQASERRLMIIVETMLSVPDCVSYTLPEPGPIFLSCLF
jgi:hypothetical protein